MIITRVITVTFFMLQAVCIYSQFRPVRVGDKAPEVSIQFMKNYYLPSAKLADFKGKLVILDFWNRRCKSCIEGFPKLNKLQEQFGDKIQILLVTYNTKEELVGLFERSEIIKGITLPFAVGDTVLRMLFPHTAPCHVWLNENGLLIGITNPNNTTAENINTYLYNGKIQLPQRRDFEDFENSKSLLEEGTGRQIKNLKFYSVVMKHLDGFEKSVARTTEKGAFQIIHSSIPDLYSYAYDLSSLFGDKKGMVIVETNDSIKYYPPIDHNEIDNWKYDNLYCYEVLLPSEDIKHRREIMKQDLDRYFSIESKVETRKVNCIILYPIIQEDRLKTKGGDKIIENRTDSIIYKNTPFSFVVNQVKRYYSDRNDMPVLDETDYKGNIDVIIKTKDIVNLKRQLNLYGIGIKEEIRDLKCLILNDLTK